VKKAALAAGILCLGGVLFAVSFAVLLKSRGGLPSSHPLARAPLLGDFLRGEAAQADAAEQAEQEGAEPSASGEATFLRFGTEAELERLADELQVTKSEYDGRLRDLERRMRELDAWERQLKTERDMLRERFAKEKEELRQLKDQLERQKTEQDQRQILIEQTEQDNLRQMAKIYGKMAPETAAQVLTEMYAGEEPETAVKIIYLMPDRSAAKTLEAITDPKICAALTEALKRIGQDVQQGG
jgi:flagellar motility protein MotE (MotC chaperone)